MKFILIISLIAIIVVAAGCTKINHVGAATINIVNAIESDNYIITSFETLNTKGNSTLALQYFATANQIYYGNSWETGAYVGSISLSLYQNTDTTAALWSGTVDLPEGSIHTLFLSGDTSAVDTLLTLDKVPAYKMVDSVAGVRFVNLSKGSQPMSVNIQGNSATQTEFNNLGYREVSAFKQYNVSSQSLPGGYTFEIRDQASDSLLATVSWSYTMSRNTTIVIAGSEGPISATPLFAFQTNNF